MSEADAHVFRLIHEALSARPVLFVMAALSIIGSGWSMLALLPLFAMQRMRRFATSLVVTLTSAAIVVALLKHVVGRTRPYASLQGIHARVFVPPTDPSFPSGHAAGAFCFTAFVAVVLLRDPAMRDNARIRRRLVVLALFVLALGIALSRIALGVHFPADVSVGAAIGTALGALGGTFHLGRVTRDAKADDLRPSS